MPEDSATRFIEDKVAQRSILLEEGPLFPEGSSRWWWDAADNHIADFTFSVATHNVEDFWIGHRVFAAMKAVILESDLSRMSEGTTRPREIRQKIDILRSIITHGCNSIGK